MNIVNLTQHVATLDQEDQGVYNLSAERKAVLQGLLTFDQLPNKVEVKQRAAAIAALCSSTSHAMIGGAPYLMGALENALKKQGVTPLYAFTARVSVETVNLDGTVTKTNVFKHIGFVEA